MIQENGCSREKRGTPHCLGWAVAILQLTEWQNEGNIQTTSWWCSCRSQSPGRCSIPAKVTEEFSGTAYTETQVYHLPITKPLLHQTALLVTGLKWLVSLFVFTSNMSITGKSPKDPRHLLNCHTKELGIQRPNRAGNAFLDSFSSTQPETVYKCSQAFCLAPFPPEDSPLVFSAAAHSFN